MIGSFKDAALEALYLDGPGGRTRRIPRDLHPVLRRKLDQMYNAADINDLRAPPGNRLEALKGELEGWHSIRVNDQWRICFEWREAQAWNVEIVDYR